MSQFKKHEPINLYNLQKRFRKNSFKRPEWQRDTNAWDKNKKDQFKKTVLNKTRKGEEMLSGCIMFFELEDDENKCLYISDGLQRTANCMRIYDELEKQYGEEIAEEMLTKVSVPTQTFIYENEQEAKKEFRLMNCGTSLTEKEIAKSILTDLDDYKTWHEEVIKDLDKLLDSHMGNFGIKINMRRAPKQSSERDNYALFLRYATGFKERKAYQFHVETYIDDPKRCDYIIEKKLVDLFESLGLEEVKNKISSMKKYLDSETALIKEIWQSIDKTLWNKEKQTITETIFRWLLHLSIYRKNNAFPIENYKNIVELVLREGQGASNIYVPNGGWFGLSQSDLSKIKQIEDKFNIYLDNKRTPKSTKQLKPGYENGHLKPFSKYGEGETIPQIAIENRSLGANELVF